MRIIMLGAPGSGKGTQADYLIKTFKIPKIATGDMLRAAIAEQSDLGRKVQSILASGQLVSDDIVLALIKARVHQPDCQQGFLFDGFPRTLQQAIGLWQIAIDIDFVIEIQVPDVEIIQRLTGRRVHVASGRTYHINFQPPKVPGIDDLTGEALIQRDDDKEAVIKQRLKVYHEQTEILTQWYQSANYSGKARYITVSGVASIDIIQQNLLHQLVVTNSNK